MKMSAFYMNYSFLFILVCFDACKVNNPMGAYIDFWDLKKLRHDLHSET